MNSVFLFIFLSSVVVYITYLIVRYKDKSVYGRKILSIKVYDRICFSTLFLVFIPLFFERNLWMANPFFPMTILVFYACSLALFFCSMSAGIWNFAEQWIPEDRSVPYETLLILVVLFYGFYFSYGTIINHCKFQSGTSELGVYQNYMLHALRGRFLVENLAVLQSFIIALGAVPLYLLAKSLLHSKKAAFLISLLYLINPAVQGANLWGIHNLCLLPALLFLLLLFFKKKNYLCYYLFLFLCLGVKEDISLCLLFVSLFLFLENRLLKHFLLTVVICTAWFTTSQVLLIHGLGVQDANKINHSGYYGILASRGALQFLETLKPFLFNFTYALKHLFARDRILYFFQMALPFAFLPLMRGRYWLLIFYGFSITLLGDRGNSHSITSPYIWYNLPFLFIGLVYFLRNIGLKLRWIRIHQKDIKINSFILNNIVYAPRILLITVFFISVVVSFQYGTFF